LLLDEYTNSYNDQHLSECLSYIAPKETVGSLAAHDDFELRKYAEFLEMAKNVIEKSGLGSEPFPGELLKPIKEANLPPEIVALLVEYYVNAYEQPFTALSDIHISPVDSIVVLPRAKQYGRMRIGSEVIGSTLSARYVKSSNILSKFVLNDNTTDTYPGQVQFFFEHTIRLAEGEKKHFLAFVKWYKPAEDTRSRFYCQIDNDNTKICNVELWKREFYELKRDCIIPIHNILGRFVAGSMTIGKKKQKEMMSVIPINRKIHI
jgi:hypothetical protein